MVYIVIGRGVPLRIMQSTNRLQPIARNNFPEEQEAKDLYEYIHNGTITQFPKFGQDPLEGIIERQTIRENSFTERFDVKHLFDSIVNDVTIPFENAIMYFIELTNRLSR